MKQKSESLQNSQSISGAVSLFFTFEDIVEQPTSFGFSA
jgi:hypothetical protein